MNNKEIRNLEPAALWNYFADLGSIPRPSYHEEKVVSYIQDFARRRELETYQDKKGNLLVKKSASPGKENSGSVVLQAHLDMVQQKHLTTNFDFNNQPIEMFIDGDWVKAKETSLGADNGIGVAAILSILASTDLIHPPIEALFTLEEEVGATGALAFPKNILKSKVLINLDSEDSNQLTIGCAGSLDAELSGKYEPEIPPGVWKGLRVSVKGLTGGHSGVDISKSSGNAILILIQILVRLSKYKIRINSIEGGGLRNAIPREATAKVIIEDKDWLHILEIIKELKCEISQEFVSTDPNIDIHFEETSPDQRAIPRELQEKLLTCISNIPNGIYTRNPDLRNLVQTSNNVSKVEVNKGSYSMHCLLRSFDKEEEISLAIAILKAFAPLGGTSTFFGAAPGWKPQPASQLAKLVSGVYESIFHTDPVVTAIHAGLECGIIGDKYPEMQMISFGPNIRGAHSPEEKVQISSVTKFWSLLTEVLKTLAENNW